MRVCSLCRIRIAVFLRTLTRRIYSLCTYRARAICSLSGTRGAPIAVFVRASPLRSRIAHVDFETLDALRTRARRSIPVPRTSICACSGSGRRSVHAALRGDDHASRGRFVTGAAGFGLSAPLPTAVSGGDGRFASRMLPLAGGAAAAPVRARTAARPLRARSSAVAPLRADRDALRRAGASLLHARADVREGRGRFVVTR